MPEHKYVVPEREQRLRVLLELVVGQGEACCGQMEIEHIKSGFHTQRGSCPLAKNSWRMFRQARATLEKWAWGY